ncbi:hypothetical protein [Roseateles sp. P5_E4]
MNSTLHKRVSAIESVTAKPEDFIIKRVIFVGANEPGEIHSCTLLGQPGRFVRAADETEDAFMERVHQHARATRQPGQLVAVALIPASSESGESP